MKVTNKSSILFSVFLAVAGFFIIPCLASAATATFSDIETRVIRDTSVNILWHAEVSGDVPMPVTGQVEYGLNTSYGNQTGIEDSAYFQSIRLTGLTPGTTYHFRLRAKDSEENETISNDYTFTTASEAITPSITGIAPNPTGDTTIDEDTVWESQNIQLAGNVHIGNVSKKVSLSIINSIITTKPDTGSFYVGVVDGYKFREAEMLISNSIISYNLTTSGASGEIVVEGYTYDSSKLEIIDSTIQGTNASLKAKGIKLKSGWQEPFHTLILDNTILRYLHHGVNTRFWENDGAKAKAGSTITNIIIDECGWGIKVGKNGIAVDYVTTYGGQVLFYYGSSWNHLTMYNGTEGLYDPANGAWIRNSWFDANSTKFNIMAGSDVIFENNTVLNAAFNMGDGGPNNGNNNTVRNCTLINTGIANRRDVAHIYNNTFQGGFNGGGNIPIRLWGWSFNVIDNIIEGGTIGMHVLPHPWYDSAGNHVVKDNIINGASNYGIKIENEYNNTFINNTISNTVYYSGIHIQNSTGQLFRDNKIINTATYDIQFGGNNDNIKFINTNFDESKVRFDDNIDIFKNYHYLDIKVVDINGNPIQDATVTIANDIDTNYPSININGEDKFSFTTETDGHTSLPTGNETDSMAILDYWQNSTTKTEMTYTITAEKDGHTQTITGINPDETWHREDPNTYQNTTTIVLDMEEIDATSPICSSGSPTGTLSSGTTSVTLSLSTNKTATCKYSTIAGTVYSSIANTFTSTNSTNHSTTITGLTDGSSYTYYIRCIDASDNANTSDYTISFSVASSGGGGGGGGTPADITPLAKVTDLTASAGDQEIVLTWQNPTDSDFVRTKILRKEDDYPANSGDGELVYDGNEETYTDTGLTNNTAYYYSAFTYDEVPNYSDPATASATPEEGKVPDPPSSDPDPEEEIYPEGTLLKTPDSFKIYVIINNKKKWIPTPEVFETLGYQWGNITQINTITLNAIPNYEDNLIRAMNDYKVYLVVNGIKRHIPNPEIFLNYGFSWDDVVDVPQTTIDKYTRAHLIRESRQEVIYYLRSDGVKKHIRNSEIFTSYNNSWDDVQVISKMEIDSYPESNLIQLQGDNRIYLIENNAKRHISSASVFNKYGYNWEHVITVNKVEFDFYNNGNSL